MPEQMTSRLITLALLVTLVLTLVIGHLTLSPNLDSGVPGSDKAHHFLAFFALVLPVSFARPRLAMWITLAAVAYGGAIELIQPYVGRDRDFMDFLADSAGAVSGMIAGLALNSLCTRRA
ncbi:VanZ family protein [Aestuariivirga sp.]|jgi:VanZ family protein|uniref:VanZ family protein n=1 Tax=Aestuariivirga sp. TaxID=2650926 RepID=UPI0037830BA1